MKNFGGKQRLYMGGWVLAALALIGLNGFSYMTLESKPLQGSSVAIRNLRQKLTRLGSGRDLGSASEMLISMVTHPPAGAVASKDDPQPQAVADKPALPVLAGIMVSADPFGAVSYTAVVNGKVCREKDKIMDYVVAKITTEGIVVQRDGQEWFIPGPKPSHCDDKGH
ncbi:MAG: hypothetical protein M0036_05280 [Desulfobacteraceae bacterium]|nr:hypothetical protein [Desulfobacteraceae bacterium]